MTPLLYFLVYFWTLTVAEYQTSTIFTRKDYLREDDQISPEVKELMLRYLAVEKEGFFDAQEIVDQRNSEDLNAFSAKKNKSLALPEESYEKRNKRGIYFNFRHKVNSANATEIPTTSGQKRYGYFVRMRPQGASSHPTVSQSYLLLVKQNNTSSTRTFTTQPIQRPNFLRPDLSQIFYHPKIPKTQSDFTSVDEHSTSKPPLICFDTDTQRRVPCPPQIKSSSNKPSYENYSPETRIQPKSTNGVLQIVWRKEPEKGRPTISHKSSKVFLIHSKKQNSDLASFEPPSFSEKRQQHFYVRGNVNPVL